MSESQAFEQDRIRPLATLPVFFGLQGKRTVIVGGGEAAAWKAELLGAAGAQVEIVADDPCHEFQALIDRKPGTYSVKRRNGSCRPEDLAGAALVVADAETDDQAGEIVCAARLAGVPVNVIDRPAYCDFQFGSIVNRSPVVIGISTSGAAPILAQAIRRRIETLLGPAMGQWAQLAEDVRAEVMKRLRPGAQRRTFWERFSDLAFGSAPPAGGSRNPAAFVEHIGATATEGRVTFVGAGPGDADLLTLRAVRALHSADVILFDDDVSADVLELARREARRMLVGDGDSTRPGDINALLIRLARSGKHVVRLTAGDPAGSRPAGGDIPELARHGIPVAIVPGIASGPAATPGPGMPLDHRKVAGLPAS